MEEIVRKRDVPPLPEGIRVRYLTEGDSDRRACRGEADIRELVRRFRAGECSSLELAADEYNEENYLLLESSPDRIFLQIWHGETGTAWACFDPDYLDSDEEAPIEASGGQSVFPMKCTMKDRELAAACVEWYAHTLEPYPGMDWLKDKW